MIAGFERRIEVSPPGTFAGLAKRDDLGMGPTGSGVKSAPDDFAVANDDDPHARIGPGLPLGTTRLLQRQRHVALSLGKELSTFDRRAHGVVSCFILPLGWATRSRTDGSARSACSSAMNSRTSRNSR